MTATTSPLVSVFMPVFNQQHFVADAVRSAASQDYPHLEVVVGDDGSADSTHTVLEEVAAEFPLGRVRLLSDRRHLGLTGNSNRVLNECRGDLIAFSAGDDVYLPGKISRQVEWFRADPHRVLCGHDVEVFDSATGRTMYRWSDVHPLIAGSQPSQFVRHGNPYHPLGNMVRAEAVSRTGYDCRIPLASDWKFFFDCIAGGGTFGYVDGVYARYRQWHGNISKRSDAILSDLLLTLDLIDAEYPSLQAASRHRRFDLLNAAGRAALGADELVQARRQLRAALAVRAFAPMTWAALSLATLPSPIPALVMSLLRVVKRRAWAR